ncbi:hypothetical protein ACP275_01G060600 [Erythranthe tilingii]
MAEALVQVVLENLSSLIQDEFGLITGVGDEMKKLSSTLTTIQSVLEDAEMKQPESRVIQNWLIKLSDLTYEIDDILDECATQFSISKHRHSTLNRYSLKTILFRRKIGTRMKQVTQELDAVAAERSKFHLREMSVDKPVEFAATRETGSILNVSRVVYGREEDAKKIVGILVNQVNGNQEVSVLPIVGVGGLGKTTLAQLVFKDQRVVDHFDKRIWVCVTGNFDRKRLLKAMIESVEEDEPEKNTRNTDLVAMETLQSRLLKLLNNKKYLIVLDDVWNEDQGEWDKLKNVVACGSTGSSIIVTTRLQKIADMMITRSVVSAHDLKGLSEEQCWMLMREQAFGEMEDEYPNLEAIGKQIANKCAGVPLAAKTLGGVLRFMRTEKEWNYVKESEIWELPQTETSILPALKLSYHHLTFELRRCFAYCAIFPKDSKISKKELIFMWMAHGYISSKRVLEMEDVGNQICDELVRRSLLQYVIHPDTNEPTLVMHDLIHDLAQSIMESKVLGTQAQSTIRQVNLREKSVAFPKSNQPEMDISFILKNFSRLRVFDASMTTIQSLPSTIRELKHVRHLNLSGTKIRTLPESLCGLWNLQVLNLDDCQELETLPKKLRYLINLRHLFLVKCYSLRETPSRIGELKRLKSLGQFIVGHRKGYHLEELQHLDIGGRITIRHLERVGNPMDAKKANLAQKKNLVHLKLFWKTDRIASKSSGEEARYENVLEGLEPHPNLEILEIRGFRGSHFPAWMSNSTVDKVVKIDISFCQNCLRLPQLGKLPHLKSLRLEDLAAVKYISEENQPPHNGLISLVQFPSLETLELSCLPKLKGLLREEQVTGPAEALPNLQRLTIDKCSSFKLPPLKKLERLDCSSSTLASLSKTVLETLTHLCVDFEENTTTCNIPIEKFANLGNLKELRVSKARDSSLLPEQGMRSLKCLSRLWISECETVTCLPEEWLPHLTALEQLVIFKCRELVEIPVGIKCVKELRLIDLAKMACLPEALQNLSSSLKMLFILGLPELSSLPEWLDKLTSLQILYIAECPKIDSFPASIRRMENLRLLSVEKCPGLEMRCLKGKGEDWDKIQHIPRLDIG